VAAGDDNGLGRVLGLFDGRGSLSSRDRGGSGHGGRRDLRSTARAHRRTRDNRRNLNLTVGDLRDHWSRSVVLESGNGGDSANQKGGGSNRVTHLD